MTNISLTDKFITVYTPFVKSDTLSNNIKNKVFERGTKMNKTRIAIFLCCILLLASCAETGTMTKVNKAVFSEREAEP